MGVYATEQAPTIARSGVELEIEAIRGALDDAGLSIAEVDGIATTRRESAVAGSYDPLHFWAEQFGQRPLGYVANAGAGGLPTGAIGKAALAISAGMCEVFVLVHGKSGTKINPAKAALPTTAPRVGDWSETQHGATRVSWYAAWARRYMHEFGVTSEQLAQVAVITRHHATLNPASIMGRRGQITVGDVLNSRLVASPLHLLDCAQDNDGGYAIVLTSARRARRLKKKPIYVLGCAEGTYIDYYLNMPYPAFPAEGGAVRKAADQAFAMAGIGRQEIDVAGLYDCFTVTLLRDLEEMGFCGLGEGASYVADGHTRLGGSMPVNTDGGCLSSSHNGHPGGMHLIEVVRQLRGEVPAQRQVPGARLGVALSQGMSVAGSAGVAVLGV
ncbi:MAG TPA: thiolase family protein [Ramlibacter sp.]|nr:thiolase family protein [Ramlibacter sp.]